MLSYGPPHMTEQKQDDQLKPSYSCSIMIRDVALMTYQKRWTIGRSGARRSGISMLVAHDEDDDDGYICVCVCVCAYIYISHFLNCLMSVALQKAPLNPGSQSTFHDLNIYCGKRNELERVLFTSCGLCFGGYCGQHECLSASLGGVLVVYWLKRWTAES